MSESRPSPTSADTDAVEARVKAIVRPKIRASL